MVYHHSCLLKQAARIKNKRATPKQIIDHTKTLSMFFEDPLEVSNLL